MKDEEIKYLEEEIKRTISLIETTYYQELRVYQNEEDQEEYPGYTKSWIEEKIKDLYLLVKVYLEVKDVNTLLNSFEKAFEAFVHDEKSDLVKAVMYHPEGDDELKIIGDFKRYLSPFKVFDYRHDKEVETIKLTSILQHTDYILKNIDVAVTNEADVYKQIKWILGLYYPRCRLTNKAGFIQEFKTYSPDILIPELRTAIEYKYIKDRKENIDNYIDQVRTDATNYTGDSRYENFIAVLYIKDTAIATHDAIHISWQQKKFPPNWELVVAMGS